MEDNPISETDPDGDCPWCVAGLKGLAQEYGTQVITNFAEGKDWKEAFTDVDGGEILKAGVADALTLGAAGFYKKAKTVVRVANATDKINDTQKIVRKTVKVKETTNKVSKVEKTVVKAEKKVVDQTTKKSSNGRSGKQKRLREWMNDDKASKSDRGWLKNDQRYIDNGNKKHCESQETE